MMNSFSPIRTLDQGRDSSLERLNRLRYESMRDRHLEQENYRLRTMVERSVQDSRRHAYQSRRSLQDLAIQNQGLNRELLYNVANTTKIENNVNLLIAQNEGLKDRLVAEEASKIVEIEKLRRKYMQLQMIGRGELEQTYTQEVGLLLRQIDRLKLICQQKSIDIQVQFKERLQQKQQYDANICKYIAQVNNLKNLLMVQESQKNQEIRQLNAKTQLERSRTVGIIGTSKESTNFMDRQIRKLAQEMSSKNSQLDELTKNYLGQKRRNDEQTKTFNDKISKLISEHSQALIEKNAQFQKRQNILKDQILDQKRKQTELHMKIDQMQNQYQILQHQLEVIKRQLLDCQNDNRAVKQTIEKQRQQHLQQITKLMNQKIRRRSSKMLSSQRSLNSSLKDSNIVQSRQDIGSPSPGDRLPIVKQQVYLRQSKQSDDHNKSLIDNNLQEQDTDYNALINHYQNMLDQLKKSHNNDVEVMGIEMKKLRRDLTQKQEEFEDLLKRFTPLVKIHAGQKSLEEDRKERMERHWKADIALLQILLDKHKIQVF